MFGKFWAVDTETTGMDADTDRIIEIYAVEVTFPGLEVRQWRRNRFNPGIPIPPEATLRHGIRDEDVENESPFSFRAAAWQEVFQDACLIAYNAPFDLRILNAELIRAGQRGLSASTPIIDPYQFFREDFTRTLTDAVRHYLRKPHPLAHTAKGDVHAMLRVLRRQMKTRNPDHVLEIAFLANRLDFSGRFIRDQHGIIRTNFGKHKGQPAGAYPAYLRWMLTSDFPEDTKRVAREVLADCATPRHQAHGGQVLRRPGGQTP